MKEKSKKLFFASVLICIWLPASLLFSYLSIAVLPSAGFAVEASARTGQRIITIINILLFCNCAWNMRESKRLLLPLCTYIMTQIIEVLFPLAVVTSNHLLPIRSMIFLAVKLLADVSLVLFYTAFSHHPEKRLRTISILASVGGSMYVISRILDVMAALSAGLSEIAYMNISAISSIMLMIGFLLSMSFWITFATVMKKISNA